MTLREFTSSRLGMSFQWGTCDCITMLADWVECQTGIDPMAALRGAYVDRETCEQETGFFSDPVSVVGEHAGLAGLRALKEPKDGAIALIDIAGEAVGAIKIGSVWFMQAPHGSTIVREDAVQVIVCWGLLDA